MNINKETSGNELTLNLEGRIDTTTAPLLEAELKRSLNGIESLVLDFSKVEYISSAGLRVLLASQKVMAKQGSMVLRNVGSEVMDVLEITGFSDILTIE